MVGGGAEVCGLLATKGNLGGAIYIAMKSQSCGRKGQALGAREPFPQVGPSTAQRWYPK